MGGNGNGNGNGSGSERKYKEKRKNREGAADSQVERKSKRSITEEERESRRSDKNKKKHSKRRSDQEKKKSKDVRKGKHHSSDPHSRAKCEELSKEDYFSKNNEFATWLKDERNLFFSDLSSESARGFFSEFVKEWNNDKLESRYYEGIASGPRTSHNWKIKSQR